MKTFNAIETLYVNEAVFLTHGNVTRIYSSFKINAFLTK